MGVDAVRGLDIQGADHRTGQSAAVCRQEAQDPWSARPGSHAWLFPGCPDRPSSGGSARSITLELRVVWQHFLTSQPSAVGETSLQVLKFEIGILAKNNSSRQLLCHQVQNQRDGNAHTANAGLAAHDLRIEGEPLRIAHSLSFWFPSRVRFSLAGSVEPLTVPKLQPYSRSASLSRQTYRLAALS